MTKQYCISLSRKDLSEASYFPGLEIEKRRGVDFIEKVLLPAILPAVRIKSAKAAETPVTFWAAVRSTARHWSPEVFLFTTPSRLNLSIRKAIGKSLEAIENINIFAGEEYVPEYALPCCQLFRNKLIRFYYKTEDADGCWVPTVTWQGGSPSISLAEIDEQVTIMDNQDAEQLFIRAEVSQVMDGNYYRKFQQALSTIGVGEG
ncbi:MAG: hypothetical protein U1D67_05235 [Dehalococcoidia bacterium]|nr:hypothetical protein [Dehalococcoidia bacterium]